MPKLDAEAERSIDDLAKVNLMAELTEGAAKELYDLYRSAWAITDIPGVDETSSPWLLLDDRSKAGWLSAARPLVDERLFSIATSVELTIAQGNLKRLRETLDFGGEGDAHDNLHGALIDFERAGADKVGCRTIRRVMGQIKECEMSQEAVDARSERISSLAAILVEKGYREDEAIAEAARRIDAIEEAGPRARHRAELLRRKDD